jgi:hypothetical protein
MDKQELLDKYLEGGLSELEAEEFERLKASDPAFNDEVAFHDDLSEVVLEDERLRLKKLLSDRKASGTRSKQKPKIGLIILLAVLLVLASIFIYRYSTQEKSPDVIYAAYFEPYPNSYRPVSRNSNDNAETQGFTAYENGNYVLAAQKFEESLAEKQDLSILFYQGISYGAAGEISLAIQKMETIKGKDFPYSSESYWYLGLFYLEQNNTNEASKNLQEYIGLGEDTEKVEQAREILMKIK